MGCWVIVPAAVSNVQLIENNYYHKNLLKEVVSAIELVVSRETFPGQHGAAFNAAQAAGVPRAVRYLEHVPVHYHFVATSAFGNASCNNKTNY